MAKRTISAGPGIELTESIPLETLTIGIKNTSVALLSGFAGANLTARLQAAVASGLTAISIDENGSLTSGISVPAGMIIYGNGRTITKAGNIDMFTLATGAQVHNLILAGNGASNTGRGFLVSAGTDQRIINCNVSDMNGYCLEFSADSAGSRAIVEGGFWQRTTFTNPAIKCAPDALETAGERKFIGLQSGGGWLFDTAGSQNTHIIGCSMLNMVFGANGLKTIVADCRVATAGVDWDIFGQDHQIIGCIVAGNINLNVGAGNVTIVRPTLANGYNILDNSGANNNSFDWSAAITPTWGADSSNPAIGDGSITGRIIRNGRTNMATIVVVMGSTTTYGSGDWFFQMPSIWAATTAKHAVGSALIIDSSTGQRFNGVPFTSAGVAPKIYVSTGAAATTYMRSSTPFTFASGDTVIITLSWENG